MNSAWKSQEGSEINKKMMYFYIFSRKDIQTVSLLQEELRPFSLKACSTKFIKKF